MEKHPKITLNRIKRLIEELQEQIWLEARPLRVSVYQCPDPISLEEAIAQSYTPVTPGFCWGPQWSTAWFHLQGDFPAAWAAGTVAALIDTGSEALVWQHGAPAQGLDANRRDFVLDAPDGTVDLYIEAAGNHHFGVGGLKAEAPFVLHQADVARLNAPVRDLYFDLLVLHDLATNLPEESGRRANLIFGMNEAVNLYRRGGAEAIPDARAVLAELYAVPACPTVSDVALIGHSHIDTAWLWPIRETIRKCSRTFSTVLKYMAEYPEYRYEQSQPQLYAYVKERFPDLYARIKQAVADGRWEPQGGMWVEADCNLISGESMVRQFLYGMSFIREEFGVECNALWLPDVFGYSAAMPQILQGCGIPYFLTQKISWNQFNRFPHHTFCWEGIDGSRVLAHFPPADTYNGVVMPWELLKGEKQFADKDRANSWIYLFGYGDGGGGPTRDMLEQARRMTNTEGLPRTKQIFSRDWFPQMAGAARDLRLWVGELYFELHRGTYTTQAKNKRENRKCEFLLRDAEFFAAIQPDGAAAYPAAALEEAWKTVLTNQFHDIIPGSSITWVYEDAAKDYQAVRATGERIVEDALASFAGKLDTGRLTRPLVVWNTLSFQRGGVVSLPWDGPAQAVVLAPRGQVTRAQVTEEQGERRLLVEVDDVPSMGYTVYDILEGEVPDDVTPLITDEVTATPRTLENGLVRLEFNDSGELISCYDKQNEREVIADGTVANRFQLLDDHPFLWDAWDVDIHANEVCVDVTTPATITVVEAGPVRAALRVERGLTPQARLVQFIRLEANTRRVDFESTVDWQESHKMLKVAFPVSMHCAEATYEIQFGHLQRPTHRNTSWDIARFEVCGHKWADLSESDYGVALLNDCKYGYDTQGNVMRLSLLRSPKDPDPVADMGQHQFTYSLLPHRGDVENSGVPLAGYDLNVPLRAQPLPVQDGVLAQSHSYFKMDKHNLLIESVKRAEDGDGLIVRLYEAYRRRGKVRLILNGLCTRATRTDLLERNLEDIPVHGGAVELDFRPFEIITLRLR